ncbi:MAG: hypothetical protein IJ816_01920 [Alloprevotella sp.]|nr:hypothetical protein [Alloprevotella sp.]
MKKLYLLIALFVCIYSGASAAKDVRLSIVSIYTYQQDGTLLHSGRGFYVAENGTAVAPYALFNNAYRAEIVDAKGKKYAVRRIVGANSSLDIVKFSIEGAGKTDGLSLSSQGVASGTKVVLPNALKASTPTTTTTITTASPFNDFLYYDLSLANSDNFVGLPLLNTAGEVVGIVQKNVGREAQTACALDARFFASLYIHSISAIDQDLQNIHIQKALPEKEADAVAYLYLLNPADAELTLATLNEFISIYPNNVEGYTNRATYFSQHGIYDKAEADFSQALSISRQDGARIKADEVHYQYSKAVFNTVPQDNTQSRWNLERALDETRQAYALNPNPVYQIQEGRCLYALQRYGEAYEAYQKVCNSPMASAESFFDAAQALEATHTDSLRVLELMDSCVARIPKPYNAVSIQYVLAHARLAMGVGKYREAVNDLNEYEKTIGPSNLTASFYYDREQVEKSARMYQQALNDIQFAQTIARSDDAFEYGVEEALLLLQVGLYPEVIDKVSQLLSLRPEDADCHKIIGIAYGETKQKAKAAEHLNRAKNLGDADADTYLKRYKK